MRKLLISLPDALAEKLDEHVKLLGMTRSAYLREAIRRDLRQDARRKVESQMQLGYQQMAQINLDWAHLGEEADLQTLARYESSLENYEKNHLP